MSIEESKIISQSTESKFNEKYELNKQKLEDLMVEANTGKEESIKKIYEFFITNMEMENNLRIKARDYFLKKTKNLDDCDPNISYYCGCMLNNIDLSNIGIGGDKHIEKAIDCLTYSANKGNLDSYRELFRCTAKNIRLESLQEKIKKYFDEKIKNNPNSDDLYWYGKMLTEKYIKEEKKANDYFIESAKKGNSKAIEELYNYINNNINNKIEKETVENAINYFKESIKDLNKCDSSTLYYYGVMLQKGKIFEKNEKEANNYFIKAAEKGNAEAVKKLYANIIDNKENSEDFINCIKNQAEKGNSEAMYVYGNILLNGEWVEKDEKQATNFFIKAAEKGNSEAIKKLYDYITKNNNNKEKEEIITNCVNCIKQQAEKGNSEAMYFYGKMLLNGYGIKQNIEFALDYFNKLIDLNNGYAMLEYANILKDGKYLKKDLLKAEKYYIKAKLYANPIDRPNFGFKLYELYRDNKNYFIKTETSESMSKGLYFKGRDYQLLNDGMAAKDPDSIYELANLNLKGTKDGIIEKNEKRSIELFKKLIDNYKDGDNKNIYNDSLNKLVELSLKNENFLTQEEKIKYYKKAVDIGNDYAKYKLSQFYKFGIYVEKNEEKSTEFEKNIPINVIKSIDKIDNKILKNLESKKDKSTDDIFKIAMYYENGIGTKKNIEKTKKYYLEAIKNNNTEANLKYANILIKEGKKEEALKYLKLFDSRKNTKKSEELLKEIEEDKNSKEQFENYKKLVKQGDTKVKYNLAECYENGIGTEQNLKEAIKLYKEEKKERNNEATYRIAQCYEKIAELKSDEKYLNKAIKYYKYIEGDPRACFALSNIYGKDPKKDIGKEFNYCREAAEMGHYEASFKFAEKYFDENGLCPDKELAKYYYETAATCGGNEMAKKRLDELSKKQKEENIMSMKETVSNVQEDMNINDEEENKNEEKETSFKLKVSIPENQRRFVVKIRNLNDLENNMENIIIRDSDNIENLSEILIYFSKEKNNEKYIKFLEKLRYELKNKGNGFNRVKYQIRMKYNKQFEKIIEEAGIEDLNIDIFRDSLDELIGKLNQIEMARNKKKINKQNIYKESFEFEEEENKIGSNISMEELVDKNKKKQKFFRKIRTAIIKSENKRKTNKEKQNIDKNENEEEETSFELNIKKACNDLSENEISKQKLEIKNLNDLSNNMEFIILNDQEYIEDLSKMLIYFNKEKNNTQYKKCLEILKDNNKLLSNSHKINEYLKKLAKNAGIKNFDIDISKNSSEELIKKLNLISESMKEKERFII